MQCGPTSHILDLFSTDKIKKHLIPNGKPNDYKTVYSMPAREVRGFELDRVMRDATLSLIGLAKHSKIFDSVIIDYGDLKNLMNNNIAILVGATLLKICLLINTKCSAVNFRDPDDRKDFILDEMTNDCENCTSNYFFQFRTLLTTNACIPNVFVCLGHENKSIMFSIQPIKAGDKLSTSMGSVYDKSPDDERRGDYQRFYNRLCPCPACEGNWMTKMFDGPKPMSMVSEKIPKSKEIYEEIRSIEAIMRENYHKATHPDMKVVIRTKNLVLQAWECLSWPSPLLILAGKLMIEVFKELHRLSEVYPDITEYCKPPSNSEQMGAYLDRFLQKLSMSR
ncbi:hypothetical protein QAD02_001287 [Eretmocerus hayati]|uniref:Uncharacterized protein n=1 Tax=Eretmocerus hayati TaxID=131215 RepID=A0ACC2NFU2_9HYME|nr:hypothetical protein QAD02_001287 [Eretmocerus hayati]